MRVASFFSGIGGFDLGLERAGMQIVFQCETNKFSRSILRKHWPEITLYDDITTLKAEAIPDSDLWCAGFPCQDVSRANWKRRGLEGERSGLFYKFAELIEQRRPKWVIMENVPGLLNSKNGEDFGTIIRKLDEFGYGVAWRVLDAKFFGTPQRRRRVFIVASYQSISSAQVLLSDGASKIPPKKSSRQKSEITTTTRNGNTRSDCCTSSDASIRSSNNAISQTQEYAENQEYTNEDRTICSPNENIYSIQNAAIGRNHEAGPQGTGYRNDGTTWTLDAGGDADVVCSTHDPFRVREFTRVPGGLDRHRYQSLGNAVAVPVVEWLGRRIMQVKDKATQIEAHDPFAETKYIVKFITNPQYFQTHKG